MIDKNADNFIVKFYEKNYTIIIEIFEISNYSNFLKITHDIISFVKTFIKSMDISIKYNECEYIVSNKKNLVEFLDKFIGLEISKIKNQNFHKYSNILQ